MQKDQTNCYYWMLYQNVSAQGRGGGASCQTCFTLVLVSRDAYNQNCKTCSTCVEGSFCINGNATGIAGVKGLLPNDFFFIKGNYIEKTSSGDQVLQEVGVGDAFFFNDAMF